MEIIPDFVKTERSFCLVYLCLSRTTLVYLGTPSSRQYLHPFDTSPSHVDTSLPFRHDIPTQQRHNPQASSIPSISSRCSPRSTHSPRREVSANGYGVPSFLANNPAPSRRLVGTPQKASHYRAPTLVNRSNPLFYRVCEQSRIPYYGCCAKLWNSEGGRGSESWSDSRPRTGQLPLEKIRESGCSGYGCDG